MSDDPTCSCGHPASQHDLQPDGTRPCRSIGHPKGVPCAECRRLTEPEHVEQVQEMRGGGDAFDRAWAAYKVTYDHARQQLGDGWRAYFTDHHQSALASALIAHKDTRQPRRGDAVEAWLKAQRDQCREQTDDWFFLDELLDQYRLHADTGTPLDQHVCERGTTDDCEDCYEAAKGVQR